jgi:hypothetical protein
MRILPLFILSILLLVFGYCARLFAIYFFWESSTVGWLLFMTLAFVYLIRRIKSKREQKKSSLPEKICLCLLSLVMLVQLIFLLAVPRSDAYAAAKEYLSSHHESTGDIGTPVSFSIIPLGSLSSSHSAEGSEGQANLMIIVKGEKKYGEFDIELIKYPDKKDWEIVNINRRW